MPARAALLLVPVLLAGCQDRGAAEREAALERRVSALEAQVRGLRAAQRPPSVAQAAAQFCADELARTLETFRQNSIDRRYPAPAQLQLPVGCKGQRLAWKTLGARAYSFAVTASDGRELARASGP